MALEAQNNPFTSILMVGAADPEALPSDTDPSAGSYRLVMGTDDTLYILDDAGVATPVSGASGDVATDAIWDAAGDLAVGSGADTAARLTKGAAATVLVAGSSTVSWVDILPWHISIIPMVWTPDATTGTWAFSGTTTASVDFPFYTPGSVANSGGAGNLNNNASSAQNDAIAYDVVLAAGTWDFHCWVRKSTNTGIITLQQDGVDQGTVDTYAAAAAAAKVSITGFTVATTGKKRMNLKMATKNGSSSNYILAMFAIEFRRTA